MSHATSCDSPTFGHRCRVSQNNKPPCSLFQFASFAGVLLVVRMSPALKDLAYAETDDFTRFFRSVAGVFGV